MYSCLFPLIFWSPICLCSLGSIFPSCKPSETIFKITFWLGYLNSCINPIIYPCFSREFKKAFHSVLRGRCLRNGAPAVKSQGHISTQFSSPCPTSNTSVLSAQSCTTVSSWCCCRAISNSSVRGPDQVPSKSLLKAWCFSASRTPVPQNPSGHRSTKVIRLSLGITGEAVWLAWKDC